MSPTYICSQCQRSYAPCISLITKVPSFRPILVGCRRAITTTSVRRAAHPQPYKKRDELKESPPIASKSIPSDQTSSNSAKLHDVERSASEFSPIRSLAKQLRKRAGATTETYIAYASCERLVKECARHANYMMPTAQQKNVDIPKSKDGEDLGQGEGWWYHSQSE